MRSFEQGFIERQGASMGLIQTIRLLGEAKGKQALYYEQFPQAIDTLRQSAVSQSTESSNRIEGIQAPADRIRGLVNLKIEPQNRSEQEIAGYRDVLNTIHRHHRDISLTPSIVRQLHRDLYKFTPVPGGDWKPKDNDITERYPDGTEVVRFKTVPAHMVPEAMEILHREFNRLLDSGEVEPLLLVPAYILDFLSIHPFWDGNGRLSRLLATLLLYQAGYEVGRYISLEKKIEETKESYYGSLHASSQGWHQSAHSLHPWWEYFLGVMLLAAYRDFEQRLGAVTHPRGAKRDLIVDAIQRMPKIFKMADLIAACPGISRPTIARALDDLRERGKLSCSGRGRDAAWTKEE